ncbi:transposase family protein [Catenuloplanes niger]|uniref:NAD(P)-dependent dehydrogenase (Short-subunit alcohol dehydrogenase family) n=1 Tax=Catenuloplanes niger TaxID=587534 RepID=A0AAE3ZXB7_9ACTN|nr:transposase family protein [Catenuloplanes niger]MDR7320794.1 NAD(P)-dependent dehydrogenase (short-subunit alcohol dehydrogenase family) [Catenuloplanes niger]MDR7323297.1 NAD(P)-dependent dehydrogenase (short-subunit alcohol dehydrogenase family) [Catenuloplanes niger]MDR7325982.1 NAD(P)-dependent dehydrogenase (short-subunit alcohol dehydrogenase family) [Catenuloplanes niger]MDR7326201.1 NAD(P)-dependent dehydrogenase (short-subunit alcohol dehydrogenase family) [Catenuloplanes niger]MD
MLDVPRELVRYLAQLLSAERRARGTRRGTRSLTCFYQALLVIVWFRKAEDATVLGAGFGISRATVYRYLAEGITVLSAQAPDLHEALQRAADEGWAFVILDGKLFDCDRLAETATSVKGETIDAWYSGKHRDFGANVQAVMRPDGLIIWTSPSLPGHMHDLSCAQQLGVTAALNWAAAELQLPALADAGYEGAGHGIKTPTKQPAGGRQLAVANRTVNRLLRGLRWQGERGFAILVGRWKTLRHTTASPRRIGDIVAAALHLTHFEYRILPETH